MHRFFISPRDKRGTAITITGSDVKHIHQVLRMGTGGKIVVSDGQGRDYMVRLIQVGTGKVLGEIISESLRSPPKPAISLFQALPKGSKMDLIVQKATELGVSEIVPVIVERTVVKLKKERARLPLRGASGQAGYGGQVEKRLKRWQQIGLEAAKQSQRSYLPKIGRLSSWTEALERLSHFDLVVVPWEEEKKISLKKVLSENSGDDIATVIGPEGGFSREEIGDLVSLGAKVVTLGEQILRTETAAMATIAAVLYHFGRLGG